MTITRIDTQAGARRFFTAAATAVLMGCAALAQAAAINAPAPAFTLTDSQGKTRSLSEFAGKTVVLEWNNPDCPFVKKHYESGNIPGQQKTATGGDVVWLVINSSAPGKQGHLDAAKANKVVADNKAAPTAYLFDGDGKVGRAYAAKTTPNLYVIDKAGVLRYSGAIDSIPSTKADDIPKARQHVQVALAELTEGKPVSTPVTQPYGCSIKYSDS